MKKERKTAKETIEHIMSELTMYVEEKGIPHPKDRMIDQYLNMSYSEFLALTNDELAGAAYEIGAKAYYIQDLVNEKRAKWEACQQQIERTVGNKVNEYNAFYHKDKLNMAIRDNDYAAELKNLQDNIELLLLRYNKLEKRLESVGYTISTLQRQRGMKNGY